MEFKFRADNLITGPDNFGTLAVVDYSNVVRCCYRPVNMVSVLWFIWHLWWLVAHFGLYSDQVLIF